MVRLAIFVILVVFIVLLARSYFPAASREEKTRLSMEMVQDPNCKIYIPKSEAVQSAVSGETRYFCSEKCAQEFQQKTG
ncbi:MAG: hypothetical protein ACE5GQ_04400 [Nitrospinales bacterium]